MVATMMIALIMIDDGVVDYCKFKFITSCARVRVCVCESVHEYNE